MAIVPQSDGPVAAAPDARPREQRHPVRWTALAVLVVVMLLVGVVFGLRVADGPIVSRSAVIGQVAPSFDLPGLRGGHIRSADYAGQMYVVNFWASWCVACRAEAADLEAFAARWKGRITLIGIDWNDTAGAADGFVTEFGLTYPQAVDAHSDLAVNYGLTGVPETYIVTADGVIAAGVIGAVGPTTLDDLVAQVEAGGRSISHGGGHQSTP
jgi:cytochrome c biogenesis protein CcmG/thiol:disulfide interchange protein DsbE